MALLPRNGSMMDGDTKNRTSAGDIFYTGYLPVAEHFAKHNKVRFHRMPDPRCRLLNIRDVVGNGGHVFGRTCGLWFWTSLWIGCSSSSIRNQITANRGGMSPMCR